MSKNIVGMVIIALCIVVGGGVLWEVRYDEDTVPVVQQETPAVVYPAAASFKDGVYTATGMYQSPEGAESLDVAVTLKDGAIVDASVVGKPSDPQSKRWQDKFISGYKVQVVGKKIADLQLTNVSGSSLTPRGFNDALEKIRAQAVAV